MRDQISVTRRVDAPPEQVFALLADPTRHQEFDTSGLVRGLAEGEMLTGVGESFVMNMWHELVGDYRTRSTVITFDDGRRIGWAPLHDPPGAYDAKLGGMKTGGQSFTWVLAPDGDGTLVTQIYDWSNATDPAFRAMLPLLSEDQLAESIERVNATLP